MVGWVEDAASPEPTSNHTQSPKHYQYLLTCHDPPWTQSKAFAKHMQNGKTLVTDAKDRTQRAQYIP